MAHPDLVMGVETEYGIWMATPLGQEALHPLHLSNIVVRGYADATQPGHGAWDFSTELPDLLSDVDLGLANVVLTNGARFYVDHAHPEYSGPEVTTARDAVVWDRAGDLIMADAARRASESLGVEVRAYKNNTDGKGSSYGTHENYLLHRATPFDHVVSQFTGFLVSRSVMTGAGRIGIGQRSERTGFQISQRADFFEAEVGLETTMNRPIINTRDEPHADHRRYRRLHVITGDATQAEYSTWLKLGTAALVLRAVEAGLLAGVPRLAAPLEAMRAISHDPTCTLTVETEAGQAMSAIELQRHYLEVCRRLVMAGRFGSQAQFDEAESLIAAWQSVLDQLAADPLQLRDRLEWVAKWHLLNSYRQRDGLDWDAPRLAQIDLQFADVDPARGLAAALMAKQKLKRITNDDEVAAAITAPPVDTRAWLRGELVRRFGPSVVAASWDSVVFELAGERSYRRLELRHPLADTQAERSAWLAASPSLHQLLS